MDEPSGMRRRDLLSLIGAAAGASALTLDMTALGHAAESTYRGPLKLEGSANGARVLVLGAGVAGMVATMELRQAGYEVELLEYNPRPGAGRGPCAVAIDTPSLAALRRSAGSMTACI